MELLSPRRWRYPVLVLALGLSACTSPSGLSIGDEAQYPESSDAPVLTMTLEAADFASECPSRVDPGRVIPGEFLFLRVRAQIADGDSSGLLAVDGQTIVSTSPERFIAVTKNGEPAGGFDPATTWECFADTDLLPMLMSTGDTADGIVVIEATSDADAVEFLVADDVVFKWRLGR